jgi:hypothetical protein
MAVVLVRNYLRCSFQIMLQYAVKFTRVISCVSVELKPNLMMETELLSETLVVTSH